MNNQPLISVVMSVYNSEEYIDESIMSILSQTFKDFEFIIINDGSTDGSLNIIKEYVNKDNRIVLISRENKGLPYSLNEGISKARGKYIARMDSDDISLPNRFEEQFYFMERNLDIGVCGTATIGFTSYRDNILHILPKNDELIKTELLFSTPFSHPTVMIRKSLIFKYNLCYNEKYLQSQDYELWTRMAEYTDMANLPTPLLRYRILEDSITRIADENLDQRLKVIKSIFQKYLVQLGINNSTKEDMLHFNLTVNTRMKNANIQFNEINAYFNKILLANDKTNKFDSVKLENLLGKKWLRNISYNRSFKAIFSKFFFYGLRGVFCK